MHSYFSQKEKQCIGGLDKIPAFISFTYAIPYVIIFITFLTLSISTRKEVAIDKIWQEILVFFVFLWFIGLRNFIFSDWKSYYPFFEKCPTLFANKNTVLKFIENSSFEKGFAVYTIIIKTFGNSWTFYQFISTVIDMIILYSVFRIYIPKYMVLGFCFYYIFSGIALSTDLMRNVKSILIFLCSVPYLKNHNFFKYLMINVIAIFFHLSAIVYIPLYFFADRKYRKRVILFIFIIGNIVYLLRIKWILPILSQIAPFLSGRLASKVMAYITSVRWTSDYGISIGYMERFFSFLVFFKFSDSLIYKNKANRIFINFFNLYIFSCLYFSEMRILKDRIPILFAFSYWILYPQVYELLSRQKKYIFLIIFFCYGLLKLLYGSNLLIYRYDNILFPTYSFNERAIYLKYISGMGDK